MRCEVVLQLVSQINLFSLKLSVCTLFRRLSNSNVQITSRMDGDLISEIWAGAVTLTSACSDARQGQPDESEKLQRRHGASCGEAVHRTRFRRLVGPQMVARPVSAGCPTETPGKRICDVTALTLAGGGDVRRAVPVLGRLFSALGITKKAKTFAKK